MFDTKLERVKDFTSDFAALDAALDRVDRPYGQTSLYDAVGETARAVADAGRGDGRLPQRSAVVVLTDGIDTHSRLTPEQVTAIASTIDVPVYVVAVMSSIDDPRDAERRPARRDERAAEPLAVDRRRVVHRERAGAREHRGAADRRRTPPPVRAGVRGVAVRGWRPLQVSARDRNLTVRARAGYNAGGEDGSKFEG